MGDNWLIVEGFRMTIASGEISQFEVRLPPSKSLKKSHEI